MKKVIAFSIEEEDLLVLDRFCEVCGMGRSKVINDVLRGLVVAARAARVLEKKKLSKLDLLRLLAKGSVLNPLA